MTFEKSILHNSHVLNELHAPFRSIRLMAIEKLLQQGFPSEWEATLKKCLAEDPDEECRMLLRHALDLHAGGQPIQSPVSAESIANEQPSDLIRRLSTMAEEEKSGWLDNARKMLSSHPPPLLCSTILRVFQNFWTESDFDDLRQFLKNSSCLVRSLALRILIRIDDKRLAPDLIMFLDSQDVGLRLLAVTGLVATNPDEACHHLHQMLLSRGMHTRSLALQTSMLMPFELVRDLIFDFLAQEVRPDLIEQAGLILVMNPTLQTPIALTNLIVRADPNKGQILLRFRQEVIEHLSGSGQLEGQTNLYLEKLKAWEDRCRTSFAMERGAIASTDTPSDGVLNHPQRSGFDERKDTGERSEVSPSSDAQFQKPSERSCSKPPMTEEALPADMDVSENDATDAMVLHTVGDRRSESRSLIQAIRIIGRRGLRQAIPQIRNCLDRPDDQVVAAAVSCLGSIDEEWLLERLGKFWGSKSMEVKQACMKALKSAEPFAAHSFVSSLLLDTRQHVAMGILCCLPWLDFTKVRGCLTEACLKHNSSEFWDGALALFLSNPDVQNLPLLSQLQHSGYPELQNKASNAIQETLTICREFGLASEKDLQIMLHPPASRASCSVQRRMSQQHEEQARTNHPSRVSNTLVGTIALFVCILASILYVFFRPSADPVSPTPSLSSASQDIEGNIVEVDDPGMFMVIETDNKERWRISLPAPWRKQPIMFRRFTGRIRPLNTSENNDREGIAENGSLAPPLL
ncbi:MAG TPA: hypothetical protein PLU72_19750 [Candidatus Ozemobacteraceae bacterium]|nr:hypothetical protein [Candidatus Ozemobacteraceae bacterium]